MLSDVHYKKLCTEDVAIKIFPEMLGLMLFLLIWCVQKDEYNIINNSLIPWHSRGLDSQKPRKYWDYPHIHKKEVMFYDFLNRKNQLKHKKYLNNYKYTVQSLVLS